MININFYLFALYCIVLYFTILYYTVLYFTVLYYFIACDQMRSSTQFTFILRSFGVAALSSSQATECAVGLVEGISDNFYREQ